MKILKVAVTFFTILMVSNMSKLDELNIYRTPKSWNSFVDLFLFVKNDEVVLLNRGCTGIMFSYGSLYDNSVIFKEPENLNSEIFYKPNQKDSLINIGVTLESSILEDSDYSKYSSIYDSKRKIGSVFDSTGYANFDIPIDTDTVDVTISISGFDHKSVILVPNRNDIDVQYTFNEIEFYEEKYITILEDKGRFKFKSRGKVIKFQKGKFSELANLRNGIKASEVMDIVNRLFQSKKSKS